MLTLPMGDLKTCDIHETKFPNNAVKSNTTFEIYVQKKEKNDQGKTETMALFVDGKEGAEGCTGCVTEALLDRMTGIHTDWRWRKFRWIRVKVKRKHKDGTETEEEELQKEFIDE